MKVLLLTFLALCMCPISLFYLSFLSFLFSFLLLPQSFLSYLSNLLTESILLTFLSLCICPIFLFHLSFLSFPFFVYCFPSTSIIITSLLFIFFILSLPAMLISFFVIISFCSFPHVSSLPFSPFLSFLPFLFSLFLYCHNHWFLTYLFIFFVLSLPLLLI